MLKTHEYGETVWKKIELELMVQNVATLNESMLKAKIET